MLWVNDGLVGYFPLDGNATDMVSGNTGTIYGATETENRREWQIVRFLLMVLTITLKFRTSHPTRVIYFLSVSG